MERTPTNVELLEKIRDYETRAANLIRNANEFIQRREFEKVSEFLWGSIADYINALVILTTGKSIGGHKDLIEAGKRIALANNDKRLFDAIDRVGQQLHANYYHGFLSETVLRDYYAEVIYAVTQLQQILTN
jgi:hypothetical protein